MKKKIVIFIIAVIILFLGFFIYQIMYLKNAHATFENYYTFRGCVQLIKRTNQYGICKTNTGQTIKIVQYESRWFLNGDLPICRSQFCFNFN